MPEPKRKRLLLGGVAAAAAAALLGAWALLPEAPGRERRAGSAPVSAPQPAPLPPPSPGAPPSGPAMSAEGLVLYGISGGGPAGMAALIGPASGTPRVVPLGKEYRPGLTLKSLGPTHAVLAGGGQETALHLGGRVATSGRVEASPAQVPPTAAPQTRLARLDAVALRLGMQPRRQDGRITGFELKPGRNLALLESAGLRPGDVIVSVNGQAFASEEKLMELPQEIAGSYTAEFEIERNGSRMKMLLPVNSRR